MKKDRAEFPSFPPKLRRHTKAAMEKRKKQLEEYLNFVAQQLPKVYQAFIAPRPHAEALPQSEASVTLEPFWFDGQGAHQSRMNYKVHFKDSPTPRYVIRSYSHFHSMYESLRAFDQNLPEFTKKLKYNDKMTKREWDKYGNTDEVRDQQTKLQHYLNSVLDHPELHTAEVTWLITNHPQYYMYWVTDEKFGSPAGVGQRRPVDLVSFI